MFNYLFGQTVFRDTKTRYSSCYRLSFEYGYAMTEQGKIVSTGHPCRSRADNGHFFAGGRLFLRSIYEIGVSIIVGSPFQIVGSYSLVELDAVTELPGRGFILMPGGEGFDLVAADLKRYDLIIVSDDRVFLSDPRGRRALTAYIEEGGSLLMLADEHSPLMGADMPEGLLPVIQVEPPRIISSELDIGIAPGEAGHPLAIAFEGIGQPPPLPARIAGLEVTGAAHVPLEMRDRQGGYPFLALQRSGRGITAVLLGFPVWRWMLAGEEDGNAYEALFGSLIPYLADGSRGSSLTVEMSRTVYRAGEPVMVTAYARNARAALGLRGEVRSVSGGDEGLVSTFMFEPDLQGRGYARAEIGPFEPGEYSVTVTETRPGGAAISESAEFGVEAVSAEYLETSRDAGFLRYLAGFSGGIALAVSSTVGAYEAERVEHLLKHQELEKAMLRPVEGTRVEAMRVSIFVSALVHGVAPLLAAFVPLLPFFFFGLDIAVVTAIAVTLAFLFVLDVFRRASSTPSRRAHGKRPGGRGSRGRARSCEVAVPQDPGSDSGGEGALTGSPTRGRVRSPGCEAARTGISVA